MGRESRRKVAQHSFPRTLETFLRLYRGEHPESVRTPAPGEREHQEPARARAAGPRRIRTRLASLVR